MGKLRSSLFSICFFLCLFWCFVLVFCLIFVCFFMFLCFFVSLFCCLNCRFFGSHQLFGWSGPTSIFSRSSWSRDMGVAHANCCSAWGNKLQLPGRHQNQISNKSPLSDMKKVSNEANYIKLPFISAVLRCFKLKIFWFVSTTWFQQPRRRRDRLLAVLRLPAGAAQAPEALEVRVAQGDLSGATGTNGHWPTTNNRKHR